MSERIFSGRSLGPISLFTQTSRAAEGGTLVGRCVISYLKKDLKALYFVSDHKKSNLFYRRYQLDAVKAIPDRA